MQTGAFTIMPQPACFAAIFSKQAYYRTPWKIPNAVHFSPRKKQLQQCVEVVQEPFTNQLYLNSTRWIIHGHGTFFKWEFFLGDFALIMEAPVSYTCRMDCLPGTYCNFVCP